MKDQHPQPAKFTDAEQKLIERLRARPELMERFAAILEIGTPTETIKQADEVEALLVEEIRKLGNVTMGGWAGEVEKLLAQQLKQKDPAAVVRKKKAELVVRVWRGQCGGTCLANSGGKVFAGVALGNWGKGPWPLQATGSCLN